MAGPRVNQKTLDNAGDKKATDIDQHWAKKPSDDLDLKHVISACFDFRRKFETLFIDRIAVDVLGSFR